MTAYYEMLANAVVMLDYRKRESKKWRNLFKKMLRVAARKV